MFGEKAAQLIRLDDAVVVLVGSRNDGYAEILPTLATTVHDVFARTKQTAPHAKLLVFGPIYPEGDPPPDVVQARDIVGEQAAAVGATFVDPISEEWLVGHPELLKEGGVHPNAAGNEYLAQKIEPLMKTEL